MKRRILCLLAPLSLAALSLAAAQTPSTQPPATQAAPVVPAKPVAPARTIPAANYVALGVYYYDQGNYDSAYVAFRAASEQDPKNSEALLGLGRTQAKLRLYMASLDTLRKLVALDARNISGYIALAQAYQAQYVGTSDRKNVATNLDDALKVLTDAETATRAVAGADQDINLSKVYNERGYVYRLKGDATSAIAAFKQASTLNPNNSVILYNLGDMYYATGDLNAAIDSLQQAVIADPRDAYSRAYYAKLLALSGNTAAARPEAAQAARLSPTNAYAVGQYGVVSYLAKDTALASSQLQAAIKLDPLRYPEFYHYLGRLELDQGQLQAARGDLTKAAALASTSWEYVYYLGLSYERGQGALAPDKVKAMENYQKALALNPDYKLAQDGLSRVK
ncbi:tetratricopeptide repeat protein [Deinococcus sp. KNUC1210]|uniref:tetratricopeptide repeat protein n=1 Tax=Deinococcus sp. KNUC1210 TaxID=2917691 RepID=UPI001EF149B5|nr:tetratricopeptide repeat protein [Deinococcus sp. KNUC1210]ULH15803.1 tetratricopeptide repeat protein [Deinococcus sp. KNUC1210]